MEATDGSQVPVLNCWAALSPYETAIILKKKALFQSESLDDAESVIKGWILLLQLYVISFPDLLGYGTALPGAEKPWLHAFIGSHFTFKSYM